MGRTNKEPVFTIPKPLFDDLCNYFLGADFMSDADKISLEKRIIYRIKGKLAAQQRRANYIAAHQKEWRAEARQKAAEKSAEIDAMNAAANCVSTQFENYQQRAANSLQAEAETREYMAQCIIDDIQAKLDSGNYYGGKNYRPA